MPGASRIEIDIERGGIGLVRVRDDGRGIAAAELPLALSRHATSKIASLEDLEAVTHARLSRRSAALDRLGGAPAHRLAGSRRCGPGGGDQRRWRQRECGAPAAHPRGTTIEVRDLFFNVPARRKFVRSEATELSHIARARRAARAVALRRGLPTATAAIACCSRRAAARCRCGRAGAARSRYSGEDFPARCDPGAPCRRPVLLSGWVGLPTASRAQADQQFWFVNGRSVRDRLLMNAVRVAYRDVLYHGRHAAYVLYLTLDPKLVDVNAHPAKLEVRFRDSRQIHDFVFRALERALAETKPDLAAPGALRPGALRRGRPAAPPWPSSRSLRPGAGAAAHHCCRGWTARTLRGASRQPSGSPPPSPRHACRTPRATRSAPRSRSCTASTSSRRTEDGLVLVDMHAASRARAVREVQGRSAAAARLPPNSCSSPSSIELKAHELEARAGGARAVGARGLRRSMRWARRVWRCAACRRC